MHRLYTEFGDVGAYANPSYLVAHEGGFYLGWDPAKTTLISLGTGPRPNTPRTGDADRSWAWK